MRSEYIDLTIDAYTESGSGSFELQVSEQQTDTLDFAFGGRLAYIFSTRRGVYIPGIEFENVSQGDEDFTIESSFSQIPIGPGVSVNAATTDDSYYNASVTLSGVWRNGKSGYFRYESLLSHDDYESDTYSLGFRIEF